MKLIKTIAMLAIMLIGSAMITACDDDGVAGTGFKITNN